MCTISTPIRSWGSTLTLPDILDGDVLEVTGTLGFNSYTPWYTWTATKRTVRLAGVQLLHSLIYLWWISYRHSQGWVQLLHSLIYLGHSKAYGLAGWGSTLTLPDILVLLYTESSAQLGFNSYTPWYTCFKITEIEDLPTTVTHFFISLPNISVDELRYGIEADQAHLDGQLWRGQY